ncbi:hypothetical protein B0H14DRAFT_2564368 [Mycena olivaceomarginata]|nr:hypothetical protein B0H14DRAFT_2564368 [Mycena olivaceomarginata]
MFCLNYSGDCPPSKARTRAKRRGWDIRIMMLSHLPPRSSDWTQLFNQMDIYYLFYVSMRNEAICSAVAEYVSGNGPHIQLENQTPDLFNRFAVEIQEAILEWLPLADRVPPRSWRFLLRFFVMGTRFSHFLRSTAAYGGIPSIQRIAWLTTHVDSPLSLDVMQCRSDNVFVSPTQFHSTCVVGCITAESAWFANLGLTTIKSSSMNSKFFHMLTTVEKRRALSVIRKWQDRGFTFEAAQSAHHICGRDIRCPANIRTSDDAGCTVVRLPYRSPAAAIISLMRPFTWSQGGQECYDRLASRWGRQIYFHHTEEGAHLLPTYSIFRCS